MPPRPVAIDEPSTPPATVGAGAAANRSVLLLMPVRTPKSGV